MTTRHRSAHAPTAVAVAVLSSVVVNTHTHAHAQGVAASAPVAVAAGASASAPAVVLPATVTAPGGTPLPAGVTVGSYAVPNTGVQGGRASADVAAPYETVVRAASDFAHYHDFLPNFDESRVVHRHRGRADVYLRAILRESGGTLWTLARFDIERTPQRADIHGVGVQGNLQRFDCRLVVVPGTVPGHVTVTFELFALPPVPLPDGMVSRALARSSARALGAFRAHVERTVAHAAVTP